MKVAACFIYAVAFILFAQSNALAVVELVIHQERVGDDILSRRATSKSVGQGIGNAVRSKYFPSQEIVLIHLGRNVDD